MHTDPQLTPLQRRREIAGILAMGVLRVCRQARLEPEAPAADVAASPSAGGGGVEDSAPSVSNPLELSRDSRLHGERHAG